MKNLAIAGGIRASSVVSNPYKLPQPEGLTLGGMSRIVMVALILFGSYLSLLFPVTWAMQSPASFNPDDKPSVAAQLNPDATKKTPSPPVLAAGTDCAIRPLSSPGGTDKGIGGYFNLYGRAGSGSTVNPDTITSTNVVVLNANNNYSIVVTATGAPDGFTPRYAINNTPGFYPPGSITFSAQLQPRIEYIIQINPNPTGIASDGFNGLTSYYNFFDSIGSGIRYGRYSKETATRIVMDDNCVPYAVIDQPIWNTPGIVTTTITLQNGQSRVVGNVGGNTLDMNLAVTYGRGIGGRLFVDDGTTNPPVFYNSGVLVDFYPSANGAITTTGAITGIPVDNEGFYTVAGIGKTLNEGNPVIPSNKSRNYVLSYRKSGDDGIATMFFCNYILPDPDDVFSGKFAGTSAIPIPFTAVNNASVLPYIDNLLNEDRMLTPKASPPCRPKLANGSADYRPSAITTLAGSGLHGVARPNKVIEGQVVDGSNGNAPLQGANVIAFRRADLVNDGTAVTDANGNYAIRGLRSNTEYFLKILPPSGVNTLVGEYYNDIQFDYTPVISDNTLTKIKTDAIGQGSVVTKTAQVVALNKGWFFSGTVKLIGTSNGTNVRVVVFKQSDLTDPNIDTPTPVDETVATASGSNDATYSTNPVLIPGESYVINFVPIGASSIYKTAWCGVRTGGTNCTPAFNSAAAVSITVTTNAYPNRNNGIPANIQLVNGVSLGGTISGQTAAGVPTDLSNPQTPINVYVYEVGLTASTPVTSSLVQYFQLLPTSNVITYQTAALVENTNYVLRFVPATLPGDPGYRSGYYSSTVITGVKNLATSQPISKANPGIYTGYDMKLLRTGGITVTLYTDEGFFYPNVRVEAYLTGSAPGSSVPLANGVTSQNGKVELTGLLQNEGPYDVYFRPIGIRGITSTNGIATVDGTFISIVFTMPRFAGFSGAVTPNNENWTGAKIQIKKADGTDFGVYPASTLGVFNISQDPQQNNFWFWDAFLPPGSYYFALIPPPSLQNKYVKHWYVGNAGSNTGTMENKAIAATVVTGTNATGLDIGFFPGGAYYIKVIDILGNVVQNTPINFYASPVVSAPTFIGQDTTNSKGFGVSPAYSGQLSLQVIPGATAPILTGTVTNLSIQNGQELTLTVQVAPAPEISGRVRLRTSNNTEVALNGIQVEMVDALNKNIVYNILPATTNSSGIFKIRMPAAAFKLRYKANPTLGLLEDMYYQNTALKEGTKDFELATVINRIDGMLFNGYDLLYNPTSVPNTDCRITDMYLLNTTTNAATIQFYSNCRATGVLGYGFVARPFSNTINAYGANVLTETVSGQGEFTHTMTIANLLPDFNYYVRPFITVTGNYVPADKELSVKTASNGRNWYFPGGNISQTPVSATEVLHIFNPNTTAASVVITYYYNNAQNSAPTVVTKGLTIGPSTQVNINVHDPAQAESLASVGFFGRHSTGVAADKEIVVERTQSIIDKNNAGYYTFGSFKLQAATTPQMLPYFPYATNNFTNTIQIVSLLNTNPVTVCAVLQYYRPNSSTDNSFIVKPTPLGQTGDYIQIPPNARFDFELTDTRLGPGTNELNYALQIQLFPNAQLNCQNLPIFAETEYRYVQVGVKGYEKGIAAAMAAPGVSQRWYFLENVNDRTYDITYHIMNTAQTISGVITLTAYVDNPLGGNLSMVRQYSFAMKAGQRISVAGFGYLFNQPAPGQNTGYVLTIDSNVPIVAARQVKYVYNTSPEQLGMFYELGATRAASAHYFPGNNTFSNDSPRYNSDVNFTVYNPSAIATSVKVTYYYVASPGGTAAPPTEFLTATLTLLPYGRTKIQPLAQTTNYPGIGPNKSFAIKVESLSGTGIIVERMNLYTSGNINGGGASFGYNPSGS